MTSDALQRLKTQLCQQQQPYEALTELGGESARILFIGHFEGEEILWDLHLHTLNSWRRAHNPDQQSNVMLIGEPADGRCRVDLALRIPLVGRPQVEMAIRMLRQYRRLARGRHQWGHQDSEQAE